jgi:Mg2+ and Co2+ transporter CorA|tara:strand:+ start:258 stop:626 length:369 start_codon:yes stop_codon:yes gene_type:complete
MATLKRLEKRMNDVEAWVKDFDRGQGPAQTSENMNWLIGQTRQLGDRLSATEEQAMQMQEALQKNAEIVNTFIEDNDMVADWQAYLTKLQKESEDALQESETESLDVQEQAEDGEEVGEGNA